MDGTGKPRIGGPVMEEKGESLLQKSTQKWAQSTENFQKDSNRYQNVPKSSKRYQEIPKDGSDSELTKNSQFLHRGSRFIDSS